MEQITLRRTIPWNSFEMIRLGDFELVYETKSRKSVTDAEILLYGGQRIDFTQLCSLARKLGLRVTLPKHVRSTLVKFY